MRSSFWSFASPIGGRDHETGREGRPGARRTRREPGGCARNRQRGGRPLGGGAPRNARARRIRGAAGVASPSWRSVASGRRQRYGSSTKSSFQARAAALNSATEAVRGRLEPGFPFQVSGGTGAWQSLSESWSGSARGTPRVSCGWRQAVLLPLASEPSAGAVSTCRGLSCKALRTGSHVMPGLPWMRDHSRLLLPSTTPARFTFAPMASLDQTFRAIGCAPTRAAGASRYRIASIFPSRRHWHDGIPAEFEPSAHKGRVSAGSTRSNFPAARTSRDLATICFLRIAGPHDSLDGHTDPKYAPHRPQAPTGRHSLHAGSRGNAHSPAPAGISAACLRHWR